MGKTFLVCYLSQEILHAPRLQKPFNGSAFIQVDAALQQIEERGGGGTLRAAAGLCRCCQVVLKKYLQV
jgi:hypothetical protein